MKGERAMRCVLVDRGATAVSAAVSFAAILLSLQPRVARADPAEPAKAQAHASLREGNALLEQGRPAEALTKFTEAYRLFPSPKLHYNIGQAESRLPGHEAQAYDEMSRFLSEAKDASAELRKAAQTQLRQLRNKVGLVTVTADPPDADLLVDGTNGGRTTRETPVVVGVGAHKLALKKDAAISPPEAVTIAGGASLNVQLRVGPPTVPPKLQPPVPMLVLLPTAAPARSADQSPGSPLLVKTKVETREDSSDRPVYRRAWFWGVVVGATVAVGASAFLLTRSSASYPAPTMGTYPAN